MQDLQWKTNRKSYIAYQIAWNGAVTLNDLEGHSQVSGLFKWAWSLVTVT